MYPFLSRGASTSFWGEIRKSAPCRGGRFTRASHPKTNRSVVTLLILCLATLGGCSSGPANPPVSVPLPSPELREIANCSREPNRNGTNIYRCQTSLGPLFVTTVKDCSIPEKFTFQATTRQLLVGVVDLTVMSQDPVTFNSLKALHSVVHGTMDVDPFIMSIYTFHQNDCVTDLVVWKGSSRQKPSMDDAATFATESSSLAKRLVPKLIYPKELSSKELTSAAG